MTASKVQEDMRYGQVVMIVSTPDDDRKHNVDYCWVGHINIAYRRRRFNLNKWNEISIRNDRLIGGKTEKQKILDGECKSQLFIFEFRDAWIVCILPDILNCIRENKGYSKLNNDGITEAYYISIDKIHHLFISKGHNPCKP